MGEGVVCAVEDAGAGGGGWGEDSGGRELCEIAGSGSLGGLGALDDDDDCSGGAYCSRMSRTSSRGMRFFTQRYPSRS